MLLLVLYVFVAGLRTMYSPCRPLSLRSIPTVETRKRATSTVCCVSCRGRNGTVLVRINQFPLDKNVVLEVSLHQVE